MGFSFKKMDDWPWKIKVNKCPKIDAFNQLSPEILEFIAEENHEMSDFGTKAK